MEQLEGFVKKGKEKLACRLKKILYGLKQVPCQIYHKFDSFCERACVFSVGQQRDIIDEAILERTRLVSE